MERTISFSLCNIYFHISIIQYNSNNTNAHIIYLHPILHTGGYLKTNCFLFSSSITVYFPVRTHPYAVEILYLYAQIFDIRFFFFFGRLCTERHTRWKQNYCILKYYDNNEHILL